MKYAILFKVAAVVLALFSINSFVGKDGFGLPLAIAAVIAWFVPVIVKYLKK